MRQPALPLLRDPWSGSGSSYLKGARPLLLRRCSDPAKRYHSHLVAGKMVMVLPQGTMVIVLPRGTMFMVLPQGTMIMRCLLPTTVAGSDFFYLCMAVLVNLSCINVLHV